MYFTDCMLEPVIFGTVGEEPYCDRKLHFYILRLALFLSMNITPVF